MNIAYNVQGKDQPTLLVSPGIISNLHVSSNLPPIKNTMESLAKFSRIINFDKRGQGLSNQSRRWRLSRRGRDIESVANATDMRNFILWGSQRATQ